MPTGRTAVKADCPSGPNGNSLLPLCALLFPESSPKFSTFRNCGASCSPRRRRLHGRDGGLASVAEPVKRNPPAAFRRGKKSKIKMKSKIRKRIKSRIKIKSRTGSHTLSLALNPLPNLTLHLALSLECRSRFTSLFAVPAISGRLPTQGCLQKRPTLKR